MATARRVGRYILGERIGEGGVAEVYEGRVEGAEGFAKSVVIKRLKPQMRDEPEVAEGFHAEARVAQRLSHGNIVQVFDFGRDEQGAAYLVMERVRGCTLAEVLEEAEHRAEPLSLSAILYAVDRVAAALHYLHELRDEQGRPLGLVHRDVTPRNVLISTEGEVKLTDFGIAKVGLGASKTLPGVIKGTPKYLSPEQASGRSVDARTDIYALGLILGQMCPEGDDAVQAIVAGATEPAVRDRTSDAETLRDQIHEIVIERGLRLRGTQLAERVRRLRPAPSGPKPISLDAALLGSPDADATRHVTPRPVAERSGPESRPQRWWWAVAAAATITIAWASAPSEQTTEVPPRDAGPPAAHRGETPNIADATRAGSARSASGGSGEADPDPPSGIAGEHETTKQPVATSDPTAASEPALTEEEDSDRHADRAPNGEQAERPPGRLRINLVPYAYVRVDGKSEGKTPFDATLPSGSHRIELHNPELGKTERFRVRVRSGKTTVVTSWDN